MELSIKLGGSLSNQVWRRKPSDYSKVFPAPLQVKQSVLEKTKAEAEKQAVNEEDTLTAIEQANKLMELFNRDLHFETHEETGIVQISVIDKNDGKVIKQIPPDAILDMVARIKDILGSLIDVKA